MSKLTAAAVLKSDITSTTAELFLTGLLSKINIDTGDYWTAGEINAKFPTAADVPLHLYLCTAELLFGSIAFNDPGFDITDFTNAVSPELGRQNVSRDCGIEFNDNVVGETSIERGGDMDDTAGSEVSWMSIVCRFETPDASINYSKSLDLRIRYMLDAKLRAAYQPPGFSDDMPAALNPYGIDNTCDPTVGIYMCYIDKTVIKDNIRERGSLYRCWYTTVFA